MGNRVGVEVMGLTEEEVREIMWEKCSTMHIPNVTKEELEEEERQTWITTVKEICEKYEMKSEYALDWRDFVDNDTIEEVEKDIEEYLKEWEQ